MPRWLRRLLTTVPAVVLVMYGVGSLAARSEPVEPDLAAPDTVAPPFPSATGEAASSTGARWIDTGDRAEVIAAFEGEFRAAIPPLDWAGSHDRCDAGTSSSRLRQATLRRVNFYRAMAGVSAWVTEDPELTELAREAAIMMSAQGELTHNPPSSFACFSAEGRTAAANSNLYLGRNGPDAIDGYIEDPGASNTDVGHRNTILHPPTRTMGVGDVGGSGRSHPANALWVFDEHVFDETSGPRPPVRELDRFVAWPPRGYVPHQLVHPRWSFMRAGSDFSRAEVALYRIGQGATTPIPVEIVDRTGAAGHVPLPAIVWEPDLVVSRSQDQTFLVVVSGVTSLPGVEPRVSPFDLVPLGPSSPSSRSTFAYAVRIIGSGDEQTPSVITALESIGRR